MKILPLKLRSDAIHPRGRILSFILESINTNKSGPETGSPRHNFWKHSAVYYDFSSNTQTLVAEAVENIPEKEFEVLLSSVFYDFGIDKNSLINMYCDERVKGLARNPINFHLSNLLVFVIYNCLNFFNTIRDCYNFSCYLWRDVEVPSWEQIVIEVETECRNFEDYDQLWDNFTNVVDNTFEQYLALLEISSDLIIEARKKIVTCIKPIWFTGR